MISVNKLCAGTSPIVPWASICFQSGLNMLVMFGPIWIQWKSSSACHWSSWGRLSGVVLYRRTQFTDGLLFYFVHKNPPDPPCVVIGAFLFKSFTPLTGRGDLGQLAGKIIRVIGNGSSTNYTYIALLKNQIMRSCIFEIIPTNALIMKCIYCGSA